jgi:hypothetical protein
LPKPAIPHPDNLHRSPATVSGPGYACRNEIVCTFRRRQLVFVAIVLAVWYAYIAFLFVAPVAVGAVLIWRGRRRHKGILVVAGVVCAVFPEAYYFLDPPISHLANQFRATRLAALPRVKLTNQDTRTLVLRSYLTTMEETVLLQTGGIDRIITFTDYGDHLRRGKTDVSVAATVLTASRAPGCETLTYELWARKLHSFDHTLAATCLATTSEHLRLDEIFSMDSIVYASDNETSLLRPGTTFAGGAYELRHRHDGRDDLIAYAEELKVERQISAFCLPVMPCLQPVRQAGIDRLKFLLESLARS